MRLLIFCCFALIFVCLSTTINGEEKTVTNPKGYTGYKQYANDLLKVKGNLKTNDMKQIVEYYEAHRTLMLGLSLVKEEEQDLNNTCNKWYDDKKKKTTNFPKGFKNFDDLFNKYYDDMQNFYYNHVEEKLGTPKMGKQAATYYSDVWGDYLNEFAGFMEKKDYEIGYSAAPTVMSQFALIGIGIISAMAYFFTNL